MKRCLELAQLARPSPNPPVGCVIVDPVSGHIVSEGFHPRTGYAHAEQYALHAVLAASPHNVQRQLEHPLSTLHEPWVALPHAARGFHVYVTLEPCNHYGRTPPCTESLIQAQVARVVIGTLDPDPRTAGAGASRLRRAGITVQLGPCTSACDALYEGFQHRIRYGRPLGILKYAMSLDGKIATETGDARWVSSSASRQYVHALRARCDAVVIGSGTLRRDDPELTVRLVENHDIQELRSPQPLRVVMTSNVARLWQDKPEAKLWNVAEAATVVAISSTGTDGMHRDGSEAASKAVEQLRLRGVQIAYLDAFRPLPPTRALMQWLFERGCNSVLWECGGNLATSAVREAAVQKLVVFIAPKLVGGQYSPTPIAADLGVRQMQQALPLQIVRLEPIGLDQDLLIEAYLRDEENDPPETKHAA